MNESAVTQMVMAGPTIPVGSQGTITITCESWSNDGRGKWRSKSERIDYLEFDHSPCPGARLVDIVKNLREKIIHLKA